MILFDSEGNEYEVPEGAARLKPRRTRDDDALELILDTITEALAAQRIETRVPPHEMLVNFGTEKDPRIERVTCSVAVSAFATVVDAVNAAAVAHTVLARLRAHKFIPEEVAHEEAPSLRKRS